MRKLTLLLTLLAFAACKKANDVPNAVPVPVKPSYYDVHFHAEAVNDTLIGITFNSQLMAANDIHNFNAPAFSFDTTIRAIKGADVLFSSAGKDNPSYKSKIRLSITYSGTTISDSSSAVKIPRDGKVVSIQSVILRTTLPN